MDSQLASFSRRFSAVVLDALVLIIPCAIGNRIVPYAGGLLVALLYEPILLCSPVRATLGKHWMGIQVTDLSGARISPRAALLRYVMKFVSSLLFFLGYIVALFTARRQAFHDLVADTVVVYGRADQPIYDAWVATAKGIIRQMDVAPASSVGGAAGDSATDSIARLERLQRLRESGALSEEEFQAEKRKILG